MTADLYTHALTGAVWLPAAPSLIRATGRDRLDLLNRMSTQEVKNLPVGQAARTVLTTPVARMVDAPWVLNLGETALLVCGAGRVLAVRKWLAGYIFFRDEVKFLDASAELSRATLAGPLARQVAETFCPGSAALSANHVLAAPGDLWVACLDDALEVIAPPATLAQAQAAALAAGASLGDDTLADMLRVRAMRPGLAEISADYIPLEVELWGAVSFAKGCYIGQEIIARMESRGKLARRLVQLRLEAPVMVGAPVTHEGREVGRITSAATLPDLGPTALTVIKLTASTSGTPVQVEAVPGAVV